MPVGASYSAIKRRFYFVLARHRIPEIMDDPVLDGAALARALEGISRLNRLSGAEKLLWREIYKFAKQKNTNKIRLLDIATGGGDVPIALLKHANHSGLTLEIDACDISEPGLNDARRRAKSANTPINFFRIDATSGDLPNGYDIVTTSLFTHHLDASQVVQLMKGMKAASNSLVLIDDLERSFLNLILVSMATFAVTRSKVVHHDAPASVKGAYTSSEMLQLAEAAGLTGAKLYSHFPCRFLLSWQNSREK